MIFLSIFVLILIDQVTKYFITANMKVYDSIVVIENIFHLTYVRNFGAAFSILQNKKIFFVVITVIVAMGIIFTIAKYSKGMHRAMLYSLALILAGAIGNLIDRIRLGYVIDFFDFRIWPVFNIADMCVVCGCILITYYMFFIEPKTKHNR